VKRVIAPVVMLTLALVVAGYGTIKLMVPHPLDQLARRAREIPFIHATYQPTAGNDLYWQAQQLENVLALALRVPVVYAQPTRMRTAAGLAFISPQQASIIIDSSLEWNARFEVLAHEAGHLFMPFTFAPDSSESEVFAEAVSYLYSLKVGRDNLDVSARYLARHKHALHVLTDYRTDIEYAIGVLR
jgi:hypothetical protein